MKDALFESLGVIEVPSSNPFFTLEHIEYIRGKGLPISVNSDFQKAFYPPIAIGEMGITRFYVCRLLTCSNLDSEIIHSRGGEQKTEVSIAAVLGLIEKQKWDEQGKIKDGDFAISEDKEESGPIFNVFYVRPPKRSNFGSGLYVLILEEGGLMKGDNGLSMSLCYLDNRYKGWKTGTRFFFPFF